MDGLQVDKVSMTFRLANGAQVHAPSDVSLGLAPGELMSVLGPSGCGKTTLLNIIAGFLRPTAGAVRLNGHPVTGPDRERGMVFQQGALFEWMTVAENVGFGLRMVGVPRERMRETVDRWLGIDEAAKTFLLFLAALFIMLIAARSGVSSVRISKVYAA